MDVLIHITDTTHHKLQHRAARVGQSFDDYVSGILDELADDTSDSASPEAELLEEYRMLVERKFDGNFSAEDKVQLQAVQSKLDDIEERSAVSQNANRKMD